MAEGKVKFKRLQVYFTNEQREWLNKRSKKVGLPAAEIVRRALDEYRERKEGGK